MRDSLAPMFKSVKSHMDLIIVSSPVVGKGRGAAPLLPLRWYLTSITISSDSLIMILLLVCALAFVFILIYFGRDMTDTCSGDSSLSGMQSTQHIDDSHRYTLRR